MLRNLHPGKFCVQFLIHEVILRCLFYLQVLHPKIKVIDLSECDISDPNLRKIDLNSAKQNRITISSRGITSVPVTVIHKHMVTSVTYVCPRLFIKTMDLLFRSDLLSRTLSTSTGCLSPSMSSVDR